MANLEHLKTILLAEDEALILIDLELTLLEAGAGTVLSATNVDDALKLIESSAIDAAVLDLHLGRSGWSYGVAKRLQEKGIPFIFSSGTVDITDGFRDVPLITKPSSSDQLISALLQVTADQAKEAAE